MQTEKQLHIHVYKHTINTITQLHIIIICYKYIVNYKRTSLQHSSEDIVYLFIGIAHWIIERIDSDCIELLEEIWERLECRENFR